MGQICVFAADSMDWTGNGQAVLFPESCTVTEEAGGEYELELIHPCDEWGKWKYLVNEAIIRAPVPVQNVPAISSQEVAYCQVISNPGADVIVYAKPLIYTYDSASSYAAWSAYTIYYRGDYVSHTTPTGTRAYRYAGPSGYLTEPPGTTAAWQQVSEYDPSRPGKWTGGGKVGQLSPNEKFIRLAIYNADWWRIRIMGTGIEGYVKSAYCEETQEEVPPTPPRKITDQCFRIYSTTIDSEENTITVNARHISYDFRNICIGPCEVWRASPSSAIATLQAATLIEDVRTIATNIELESGTSTMNTVTADWSWNNAIYALMDEDEGLVHQLEAKLIRDNNDFFILRDDEVDTGVILRYGDNLIGVTLTEDCEELITRIVPRAKDSDDSLLLLPEQYADSPFIDNYATIRMELMDSGYKVGEEYKDEFGDTTTLDKDAVYILMRKDCNRRFNVDRIDEPVYTLDIEFLLLGDTEEYAQYKGLQMLALYDTVRLRHTALGYSVKMKMTGYTWDCMTERYQSAHFDKTSNALTRTETVTRPEKAMTADTSDLLKVSASSQNPGSNPVYYAFNNSVTNGWVPNPGQTGDPWIQIRLDVALTEIEVDVYSRDTSDFSYPTGGYVNLSNDGSTWSDNITFGTWASGVQGALVGTVQCENQAAFTFVRLTTTTKSSNASLMSIGYIKIRGKAVYKR